MITQLHIKNVKETADDTQALTQHNLIIGGWGSGKTTILDALQVGTQCKMLSEDYKGAGLSPICDALCTGDKTDMVIGIDSTQLSFVRTFHRKNGTFSQNVEIPAQNVTGVKACEPFIDAVYENAIFDVRQLRKNPDIVKDMLLYNMPLDKEKWNKRTLIEAVLQSIIGEYLGVDWIAHYQEFVGGESSEMYKKAIEALAKKNVNFDMIRKHQAWTDATADNFILFLERAIQCIANERKVKDSELRNKKKALQGLMDTDVVTDSPETIPTLRSKLDALQQEESKQSELLGRAKNNLESRQKALLAIDHFKKDKEQRLKEIQEYEKEVETMNLKANPEDVALIKMYNDRKCAEFLDGFIKHVGLCADCKDKIEATLLMFNTAHALNELLDKTKQSQDQYSLACGLYDKAEEMLKDMSEPEDVTTIQNLLTGIRSLQETLKNHLQTAIALKTTREEKQQLQLTIQQLSIEQELFRITESGLKEYYNNIVMDSIKPFVEMINRSLPDIVVTWQFYVELDARYKIEFGISRPHNGSRMKIPYRALSGAETVFARNILGAMLLKQTSQTEKILLDEIAELPVPLVPLFLDTIHKISGTVQCFFATCHKVEASAEWNVIKR